LKPLTATLQAPKAIGLNGGADFNKNNFDCLRLMLASIVALFHMHALTNLPAFEAFEVYLSPQFAVRSFFVISGLLIYRSYMRSSSPRSYFEKRIRRIYPAYFTVIVLAAIGLFPLSILPASQYFGLGFWKYLGANLIFLNFLAPTLPGVFTQNTIPAVNGALWTLKIEVAFYLFVPILHFLCSRFGTKRVMGLVFFFSCLWKYGLSFLASTGGGSPGFFSLDRTRNLYAQMDVQFPAQLAYFAAGVLLLLYFDKLKLHFRLIAVVTAVLFLIDHFFTRGYLDVFWVSGVVFIFGFLHYFGNFSKYGDFSYGVYIIHWPILQVLIAFGLAALNPALFFAIAVVAIAVGGFLMWTLVESRFLSGSSHYLQGSAKAAR
jgi:peptidoglycan/LPS O-acetylase OafA/YrhL